MIYNWKDKTILIAEDSEMNFILIKKSLEASGAKILWAKNGEELIESVKMGNGIDLILMDISMPKMNGYVASKTLRNEGYDIPIIAQSAFSVEEEKDNIIEAGCNDFISKPINKEELLEKINSLI
jgi:two-component system cell cycle response regulator DivK